MQKLLKPFEIKARLDRYVVGQELAKETLSVAVYNHYKRLSLECDAEVTQFTGGDVEVEKSNVLLLGPSGTGKTLLASTLARIVGVPFVIADATTLTQAGYVGDDVDSILSRLLDSAEGSSELAEWGIVYIDEIDKLARAGESAHGTRDVSGEGVQQALLKLVEGTRIKLALKGAKHQGTDQTIDTGNILFIAGGAFAGLEKRLEQRIHKRDHGIGFHVDLSDPATGYEMCKIFEQVQPDDLRYFGLIPEFVGRFPIITALHDLDEHALVRILTEPSNALVKQYQRLFEIDGVRLSFTERSLIEIARQAIGRGTGARGLRGVLEGLLRKVMFDLPSIDGAIECAVTETAVTEGAEIKITFAPEGAAAPAALAGYTD